MTFSLLCPLLPKAKITKLTAIDEEECWQGICTAYLAGIRSEVFDGGYAVRSGFVDVLKFLTNALNELERRTEL